ncbi:hypothetical protein PENTCL1PPCAC_20497, partial [Pristionchus entomophagus]
NREGFDSRAYIKIGDDEIAKVNINMQLSFDPNNNGSLDVKKRTNGLFNRYNNGSDTITSVFNTNYFEIRWHPDPTLKPS